MVIVGVIGDACGLIDQVDDIRWASRFQTVRVGFGPRNELRSYSIVPQIGVILDWKQVAVIASNRLHLFFVNLVVIAVFDGHDEQWNPIVANALGRVSWIVAPVVPKVRICQAAGRVKGRN